MQILKLEIVLLLALLCNCSNNSSGKRIQSSDGIVSLSIPEGAMVENASITIEQINVNGVNAWKFSPSGLKFSKPATISILASGSNLVLAHLKGTKWDKLSDSKQENGIITATVTHFSIFSAVNATQTAQYELFKKMLEGIASKGYTVQVSDEDIIQIILHSDTTSPSSIILGQSQIDEPFDDTFEKTQASADITGFGVKGVSDTNSQTAERIVWDLNYNLTNSMFMLGIMSIDIDQKKSSGFQNPFVDRIRTVNNLPGNSMLGEEFQIQFIATQDTFAGAVFKVTSEGTITLVAPLQKVSTSFNTVSFSGRIGLFGNDDGSLNCALTAIAPIDAFDINLERDTTDLGPNNGYLSLFSIGSLLFRNISGNWGIFSTVSNVTTFPPTDLQFELPTEFFMNLDVTGSYNKISGIGVDERGEPVFLFGDITINGFDINVTFTVSGRTPFLGEGKGEIDWTLTYNGLVLLFENKITGSLAGIGFGTHDNVFTQWELSGGFEAQLKLLDFSPPFTFQHDVTPPSTSFNPVTVTATYRDHLSTIAKIEASVNDKLFTNPITLIPFDGAYDGQEEQAFAVIDVSTLSQGFHTIFLRAIDSNDNLTGRTSLTVIVDRTAPTVTVTSPQPGQ